MSFPLSWRSSFTMPASEAVSITIDEIRGALGQALQHEHASKVRLVANGVTYRMAWFSLESRWNVLAQFDRGAVCVHRGPDGFEVEYEVSLLRLFWTNLVLVLGIFAVLMIGHRREPLSELLPLFLFGWCVFYGASAFISIVRYSEFLRRVVSARLETVEAHRAHLSVAQGA